MSGRPASPTAFGYIDELPPDAPVFNIRALLAAIARGGQTQSAGPRPMDEGAD